MDEQAASKKYWLKCDLMLLFPGANSIYAPIKGPIDPMDRYRRPWRIYNNTKGG